jgi:osmoprotectant transport system substrate-binding protein
VRRFVAAFGVAVLLGACTTQIGSPAAQIPRTAPPKPVAIGVAAFNFPEGNLLAELYAQALASKGFSACPLANLGPREAVEPALAQGLVQLVPEYAGSALNFLTLGRRPGSSDTSVTSAALDETLAAHGLVPVTPSAAQDNNAIAVTDSTAGAHGLTSIGQLVPIASSLVFRGPPECIERPFCLKGLEDDYGLHFKRFVALDAGGPLSEQALATGAIDVGLVTATDPSVAGHHLVVLSDNLGLQPAENVTPVASAETVMRWGPGFSEAVDGVSAWLTTNTLRDLNGVVAAGRSPASVVSDWLATERLG